jgi:hypothetical protein
MDHLSAAAEKPNKVTLLTLVSGLLPLLIAIYVLYVTRSEISRLNSIVEKLVLNSSAANFQVPPSLRASEAKKVVAFVAAPAAPVAPAAPAPPDPSPPLPSVLQKPKKAPISEEIIDVALDSE